MGCFLSCFRVREDDRPRRSRAICRESNSDTILSPNILSSLFQHEAIPNLHGYERLAKETVETPWKNQEDDGIRLGSPCTINGELIDEAKFLKACGTIKETPTEIRKAVKKRSMVSPPIVSDKQPEVPPTPSELCRNSTEDVNSLDHTPCSCISNVQNTGTWSVGSSEGSAEGTSGMLPKHPKAETDMVTPFLHRVSASEAPSRQKSVRFETNIDRYSTRAARQPLKMSELLEDDAVSKPSPYPTPLKLSDEMQTPGTVFAANMESVFHGKGRIRSQYVYPDTLHNFSQWKDLKNECARQNPEMQPQEELGLEASYSLWLKRPYEQQDGDRTPGDRPIIGLVAAHWNEDECGNRNAKAWDGNGIPNTTNKYKEDQRVTWHATPFEERLEKALSKERFVSQQG